MNFGWTISAYSHHENGIRGIPVDAAQKYARAFGVSAGWLLTGENKLSRYELSEVHNPLQVIGIASAGTWRDTLLGLPIMKDAPVIGADTRFPAGNQYLIKIEGNSIDKKAGDGSFAHCVDFASTGRGIRDKDFVLIERNKPDGTVETAIKLVVMLNGEPQLCPHSTDSSHKPLKDNGDPDITVKIKGIVLKFYGANLW